MLGGSMYCKHDLAEGERDILDQGKNNSMYYSLLTLCHLPTSLEMFNKALLITIVLICMWEQKITLWAPDQSLYTVSGSQRRH